MLALGGGELPVNIACGPRSVLVLGLFGIARKPPEVVDVPAQSLEEGVDEKGFLDCSAKPTKQKIIIILIIGLLI